MATMASHSAQNISNFTLDSQPPRPGRERVAIHGGRIWHWRHKYVMLLTYKEVTARHTWLQHALAPAT